MIGRVRRRRAFTIVELLVVVFVITLLVALLLPALGMARASARRTQCQSNLRQIGVGLATHAEINNGPLCSGAFDWEKDGAVTEHSWIADLVEQNIPVGEMLCPSNPSQGSEALEQLLTSAFTSDACNIPRTGKPPETLIDGTKTPAPCYLMATDPSTYPAGSEARRALIEGDVVKQGFNTNFVPTWFLVRSEVLIEQADPGNSVVDGNHENKWEDAHSGDLSCAAGNKWRNSTSGPLNRVRLDRGNYPASAVPLMGDGGSSNVSLSMPLGDLPAGTFLVPSMTRGPVRKSNMQEVNFPSDQAKPAWFAMWNNNTRQDYSQIGALHSGTANILFADGGVRTFKDTNGDGVLNNGFATAAMIPGSPYTSSDVEIDSEGVVSKYSLNAPRLSVAP